MTNNPATINAVHAAGIEIVERLSANVPGSPHSDRYLATKREKLGHFLNPAAISSEAPHRGQSTHSVAVVKNARDSV